MREERWAHADPPTAQTHWPIQPNVETENDRPKNTYQWTIEKQRKPLEGLLGSPPKEKISSIQSIERTEGSESQNPLPIPSESTNPYEQYGQSRSYESYPPYEQSDSYIQHPPPPNRMERENHTPSNGSEAYGYPSAYTDCRMDGREGMPSMERMPPMDPMDRRDRMSPYVDRPVAYSTEMPTAVAAVRPSRSALSSAPSPAIAPASSSTSVPAPAPAPASSPPRGRFHSSSSSRSHSPLPFSGRFRQPKRSSLRERENYPTYPTDAMNSTYRNRSNATSIEPTESTELCERSERTERTERPERPERSQQTPYWNSKPSPHSNASSHPHPHPRSNDGRLICMLYQKDRCKRVDCKYAHVKVPGSRSNESHLAKTRMCTNIATGVCRFGDRCTYAHDRSELVRPSGPSGPSDPSGTRRSSPHGARTVPSDPASRDYPPRDYSPRSHSPAAADHWPTSAPPSGPSVSDTAQEFLSSITTSMSPINHNHRNTKGKNHSTKESTQYDLSYLRHSYRPPTTGKGPTPTSRPGFPSPQGQRQMHPSSPVPSRGGTGQRPPPATRPSGTYATSPRVLPTNPPPAGPLFPPPTERTMSGGRPLVVPIEDPAQSRDVSYCPSQDRKTGGMYRAPRSPLFSSAGSVPSSGVVPGEMHPRGRPAGGINPLSVPSIPKEPETEQLFNLQYDDDDE